MDEALKRLPQEVVDARNQRLKRALDINMKHSELPKELQALQMPFEPYLKVCGGMREGGWVEGCVRTGG